MKRFIWVSAWAVVPCYGRSICVRQPAAKVMRLDLLTCCPFEAASSYSLYSYHYMYWGSSVLWVWNLVEVALSAHQPQPFSPLVNSPQHTLLFDEGRRRWKHILYHFLVLKHTLGWNLYSAPLMAWMFKAAGIFPWSQCHGWTAAIAWGSGTALCVWLRFQLAST